MFDCPWITYSARKKLDKIIQSNFVCFEWGSGGSTLYFAGRTKRLISIEHDPDWYNKVAARLQEMPKINCDYRLIEPENFNFGALVNRTTGDYRSTDEKLARKVFYKYCRQITEFPDSLFDLIFVDGRARVSCLTLSPKKIKPGGWLVLDNSERKEYLPGIVQLKNWKRLDFFGSGPYSKAKWQTSLFQKP